MKMSRRMLVLLDVLVGVLVLFNVVTSLAAQRQYFWLLATGCVGSVLVALCWIAWRVWRDPRLLQLMLIASALAAVGGGGAVPLLLTLLSISLVIASNGLWYGIAGLAVYALVATVTMVLVQRSLAFLLLELVSLTVLGGLGLVLGQLLRELAAERRTNQRLLDELRAATHVEKELMLADERARSARELHDGLGHRLTLIGMSLEYAERIHEREPEAAYAEVGQAREQARDAMAYMRRWVRALNPPREANLSGIAAFEAIAESFRGTGLEVVVRQRGIEQPLGHAASLFAYRLVQEGLTNVLRHSTADRVEITVHWRDRGVEIEIGDNGAERGTELAETQPGFGLRSLAERAEQLGGSFSARSDARGVVLTGSLPEAAA